MLGVYIHTPYCVQKCPYCDFATVALEEPPLLEFESAVITEISGWTQRLTENQLGDPAPLLAQDSCTVYLGGGTPSLLEPDSVDRILQAVRTHVGVIQDAEITMEVNPGTEDTARFQAYRALGVNRLSIGVQSLTDSFLQKLGRIHTADESRTAVERARAAGFDNVSIDLMFALPGMTIDQWRATLSAALELEPDHVSAYALTVEPATPLAGDVKAGLVQLPGDDLQADMYEMLVDVLGAAGLPRYEISSFAAREQRSRHNSLYWSYDNYLSFGPSAHSFVRNPGGGVRWWNDRNPARYLETAGHPKLGGKETLAGEVARGEFAFTALRTTDGVDTRKFREVFGADFDVVYKSQIDRHVNSGLLERDPQSIRLTPRGFLLANTVFADFVAQGRPPL